jgi:predicted DNA-binding transcriptional regulator AlpA
VPKKSKLYKTPTARRRRQLLATTASTARASEKRARAAKQHHVSHDGDDADHLSPFKLFRVGRLAQLLDVDRSTIWRWLKSSALPPLIQIGGVRGLTGAQLQKILAERAVPTPEQSV